MSSNPPTETGPADHPPAGDQPAGRLRAASWRDPAAWPLRTRLVAAMIALLAVVALVIGGVTEVALHRVLYQQLDDELVSAATRPAGGRIGRPTQRPDEGPRGPQPRALLRADITAGRLEQTVEIGVDAAADLPPSSDAVLLNVPVGAPPRTYDLGADLGEYRLVARQLGPRGVRVVVIGLPVAPTRSVLLWVAVTMVGVTVLALVVAGWAGALIVRRTLRPLDRMAATAGRVAQLRLDRGEVALADRVPDADSDPRTEVGQVGAALNRMLGHVANALAARQASETQVRQFVADASHELRTPLAAIRGYAELSRRGQHAVPPDVAHVLRRVESEAQRMTTLVEDLLLLARLDAGRPLSREPVDLVPLVVDAVSDAHAAGPEHDWRLAVPAEPVVVVGDSARLQQVLANLLANARTHTPPGTLVETGVAVEAGAAVLRITDHGPGIAPELLPHIFERFARGDTSRSRSAGSTGLGLAIVHAVVTAHAGTLDVRSAPGRTQFAVRLPLAPAAGPAPDADAAPLARAVT